VIVVRFANAALSCGDGVDGLSGDDCSRRKEEESELHFGGWFGGVMKSNLESEELVQVKSGSTINFLKEPHVYTPS
jgi:hypothetical protein